MVRARRIAHSAGAVDLLVLGEGDDVQVPLAVAALVAADQPGPIELGQVVLDLHRPVLAAQRPQQAGDDRGLITQTALVVGLGEQPEEGPLGGQRHGREGLRRERLGLDGADTGNVDRPPFEIREEGQRIRRRRGAWTTQPHPVHESPDLILKPHTSRLARGPVTVDPKSRLTKSPPEITV
ncbi:hypothetical protein GCM10010433_39780 [Streptomyces pulveraceus]